MCSILTDASRLSEVTTWYAGLNNSIVSKLALTPDHNVSAKETLDYIMFVSNVSNPHAAARIVFDADRKSYLVVILVTMLGSCSVVGAILIKRRRHN